MIEKCKNCKKGCGAYVISCLPKKFPKGWRDNLTFLHFCGKDREVKSQPYKKCDCGCTHPAPEKDGEK